MVGVFKSSDQGGLSDEVASDPRLERMNQLGCQGRRIQKRKTERAKTGRIFDWNEEIQKYHLQPGNYSQFHKF